MEHGCPFGRNNKTVSGESGDGIIRDAEWYDRGGAKQQVRDYQRKRDRSTIKLRP